MMKHLTLRQLRTVAAIQSTGTVAAAAKQLGLTAPALSLQLREAEQDARTPLFERTNQGMRPTAAGRAFTDAARAIEERLALLATEIDAIRGVRKGELVLGAVSTAKYFAPQLIAWFMKAFPDIRIKLLVGNRAQIVRQLGDYEVDLALMGRAPRDFEVIATPFGSHPLIVIAAPDHPLAGRRGVPRARIAREHFIIREAGSGTRSSFEHFLGDLPGRLAEPDTEMDSNETIKQAVMAGLGVALISAHTVASELEAGRLVMLDVAGLPIMREWFSVVRADRTITPVMEAFIEFLKSRGAELLPRFQDEAHLGA